MLRPIFAVLGSFVVLTNLLEDRVSKPQSPEYRPAIYGRH